MSDPGAPAWDPEGAGWPHPSEWAGELHRQLSIHAEIYEALLGLAEGRRPEWVPESLDQGPDEARASATACTASTLAAVLLALNQLPAFRDQRLLRPLTQLLMALEDLDRGRRPKLLMRRPGAKRRQDTVVEEFVKTRAIFAAHLAMAHAESDTGAYRIVAEAFSYAGWKQKRNLGGELSLSIGTVREWVDENSVTLGETRIARQVAEGIEELKASGRMPNSLAQARSMVRRLAQSKETRLADIR
jgi:hypothetical protein